MQYRYAIPVILLAISCSSSPASPPKSQGPTLRSSPPNARITPLRTQELPTPSPDTKTPYNSNAGQETGVKVEARFTVGSDCPEGMVHIKGDYCPEVQQKCLEWMTKEEADKPWARCKRYQAPSVCLSKHRVNMDYCIDREELHDNAGMPYGNLSWTTAKQMCEEQGARLCSADEWTFAVEGEEMLPYPYGNGYEFSNTICNIERHPLVGNDGKIFDHRANEAEFPRCTSKQFGLRHATGNIDEWIEVPRYESTLIPGLMMRSALVGGHFLGGRHRVRAITKNHDEHFTNPETLGTRCCKSVE